MAISSITPNSVAAATGDVARTLPLPLGSGGQKVAELATTDSEPSPAHVAQAVKQVNDNFSKQGLDIHASLEIDKATGISVVKFQDTKTKEVINQYPTKAIIAIAEAFDQAQDAKGQLLNVRA